MPSDVIMAKLDSIEEQQGSPAARIIDADVLLTEDDKTAIAEADEELRTGRTGTLR